MLTPHQAECAARRRRFRARGIRYVLLSLLLTAMLLTATGCAALLFGAERDAYDRLVKAADYFKYPETVRIVSGEMSGSTLYCQIEAENSLGRRRSDTYAIGSSGYPREYYDSSCYSDKLNVVAINSALAVHFGTDITASSKSSSNKNDAGGITGMVFVYVLIIIVLLVLNGLLASKASEMAEDKGYAKSSWFHMCFWLGPIPYIIIAAMPDRTMHGKLDETNKLLRDLLEQTKNGGGTPPKGKEEKDVVTMLPTL